jgi:hypothetical protein
MGSDNPAASMDVMDSYQELEGIHRNLREHMITNGWSNTAAEAVAAHAMMTAITAIFTQAKDPKNA